MLVIYGSSTDCSGQGNKKKREDRTRQRIRSTAGNLRLHKAVRQLCIMPPRKVIRSAASLLLDLGERRWIDKQNKRQKSPLIEAASNGFPRVVKILLEHGADPTVQASGRKLGKDSASCSPSSGLGFTVLHAAIAFQEWECVEILIAHCAAAMSASELSRWLDMTDHRDTQALALATEENASKYVDLLVRNGATLSASSSLLEPDNQALYDIGASYLMPCEQTQEAIDLV